MKIDLRREKIRKRGISRRRCKKLYIQAFPKVERVPFRKIFRCCKRSSGDLWAFYDGRRFVGFACVLLGSYAYLLFCAVQPELRSKGYGSAMISNLRQAYAWMDMILDIEPPDENAPNAAERTARYEFYIRSGFKDTGWEMTDETGNYRIFSADGRFNPARLKSMYSILPSMFPETKIVRAEYNAPKKAVPEEPQKESPAASDNAANESPAASEKEANEGPAVPDTETNESSETPEKDINEKVDTPEEKQE